MSCKKNPCVTSQTRQGVTVLSIDLFVFIPWCAKYITWDSTCLVGLSFKSYKALI